MVKRIGWVCGALLAALAAAPAAAGSDEFVQVESRPFAESAAKARALLKNQPQQPAPSLSVLSARIAADGTITTRCESQSSPAYRAWVEELRDVAQEQR
jgi:hypothetical protein